MMTRQEAIDLFASDDLIGIGMAADAFAAGFTRKASSPISSIATSTTPISARNTAASAPSIGLWVIRKAISSRKK